jgi:metal-responsive CopG/Arc/MetJ family transcriptional regulator
MPDTVKIAISLPRALLDAADAARQKAGVSRSMYFRQAVEEALHAQRDRLDDENYARSYREQPEDAADVDLARRLGRSALKYSVWE